MCEGSDDPDAPSEGRRVLLPGPVFVGDYPRLQGRSMPSATRPSLQRGYSEARLVKDVGEKKGFAGLVHLRPASSAPNR